MRKSQEKRKREKTTETSKRITRRNNKLTDCEKGKREGQREKGERGQTRTLIDTMTMDRDMVRGSASRRDRTRALVDSEGAGVNDNDNEKVD